jgi:hypothetical protein
MADQNKNSLIIYIVSALMIIALIFAGTNLITQSNSGYKKSMEYTDFALKDSVLKAKSTFAPNYSIVKDGYTEALLYFTLALGIIILVVLLPRLQNVSIGTGGINLTLKDLPQKVDDLIKQTNAIQASSTGEGGIKGIKKQNMQESLHESKFLDYNLKEKKEEYNDDPQKGKWGGINERNERRISGEVVPSKTAGLYKVTIKVESTNKDIPLKGLVKFHLHDSFHNPDPIISVEDGLAVLRLSKVFGAFTVGAEADNGQTILELDLAELKDAPKYFKEK